MLRSWKVKRMCCSTLTAIDELINIHDMKSIFSTPTAQDESHGLERLRYHDTGSLFTGLPCVFQEVVLAATLSRGPNDCGINRLVRRMRVPCKGFEYISYQQIARMFGPYSR